MGLTIKFPVNQESYCDKVMKILEADAKNAYTVGGLLVLCFGAKPEDLVKPFRNWPKGMPNNYNKVKRCLEKNFERGIVRKEKHGKALGYSWLASNNKVAPESKGIRKAKGD